MSIARWNLQTGVEGGGVEWQSCWEPVLTPIRASAHDAYDDSESRPLRLVAYAISPIGFALEWLVMRPIHFAPERVR